MWITVGAICRDGTEVNAALEGLRGRSIDSRIHRFMVVCARELWDLFDHQEREAIESTEACLEGRIHLGAIRLLESEDCSRCVEEDENKIYYSVNTHNKERLIAALVALPYSGWLWDSNDGRLIVGPIGGAPYSGCNLLDRAMLLCNFVRRAAGYHEARRRDRERTAMGRAAARAGRKLVKTAFGYQGLPCDDRAWNDAGKTQLQLFADIFGCPFRPVAFDPHWRTADTVGLARAIYDDRAFERMPILADALMDAGCENEEIIGHCRGEGPHVRGCWVVDMILEKE